VARVFAYFGFDLPVTFPYYQGSNAGKPIQKPLAIPIPEEEHFCVFLGGEAIPKIHKKLLVPNFQLGVIFEQ